MAIKVTSDDAQASTSFRLCFRCGRRGRALGLEPPQSSSIGLWGHRKVTGEINLTCWTSNHARSGPSSSGDRTRPEITFDASISMGIVTPRNWLGWLDLETIETVMGSSKVIIL